MKCLWLLFLLLLCGLAGVQAQTAGNGTNETTSDPGKAKEESDKYKLKEVIESATLEALYKMARGFSEVVGPNEPIFDDVIALFNGNETSFRLPEDLDKVMKIVKKEAGFMACLAFGLLLFLGLGISGAIFCCCRCCCGSCGGRKVQELRDADNCSRRSYACLLSITMIFMIAAVACGYVATDVLGKTLIKSEDKVITILDDTSLFFNSTSQSLNEIAKDGVHKTLKNISSELDRIKETFGVPLRNYAEDQIQEISNLAKEVDSDVANITKAKTLLKGEITGICSDVKRKLTNVKTALEGIKRDCGGPCAGLLTDGAQLQEVDTTLIPDLNLAVEKEVEKFRPKVADIPENVEKMTKNNVAEVKRELDKVDEDFEGGEFQKIINDTSEVAKAVPDTRDKLADFFKQFNEHDSWYYAMGGVVSLLTIPVLLICLGMFCGCAGHRESRHPSERGCCTNWGGCTMITGVYLLFFITGIPILITTVMFQVGGHVQTHFCTVIYEEDLKSFDRYFEMASKEFQLNDILKDIQPSRTFRECENGASLVTALNLTDIDKQLDFQNKMNLSKYLDDFNFDISKDVHISPDEVTKKTDELDRVNDDNFKKMKDQVENFAVNMDELKNWIDNLETLKETIQDGYKTRIDNQIKELNGIAKTLNEELEPKWADVRTTLRPVDIGTLKENGNSIAGRSGNITTEIQNEANRLKIKFQNRMLTLVNDTVDSLKNKFNCEPVWMIFDNSRQLICRDILDPFNAYWFSLGWALFFSIFAIAFATQLSKHYMRMSDMKRPRRDDDHSDPRDVQPTEYQPCIPMKHNDPYYYQNQGYQTPPPRGPPGPPGYYPQHPPQYGTQQMDYDDRMKGFSKY